MSQPKRIQLRRTKGWRKPEGAVVVARPSKWGNPFKIEAPHPVHGWPMSRAETVDLYRDLIRHAHMNADFLTPLIGRDLACWCLLVDAAGNRMPCHADVLLEIANPGWTPLTEGNR